MARRLDGRGIGYDGTTRKGGWSGQVNLLPDLFHPDVPFEFIAAVFGVMAATPKQTYQVLTKRARRMAVFFDWLGAQEPPDLAAQRAAWALGVRLPLHPIKKTLRHYPWPLLNVWLGVSVEDQPRADERIPHLLRCPAAVRFLSIEPLLAPVDLLRVTWPNKSGHTVDVLRAGSWDLPGWGFVNHSDMPGWPQPICWVIVGSESGPGRRETDVHWVRSIRDQCIAAGVPLFLKQLHIDGRKVSLPELDGQRFAEFPHVT
jgi:protein gp37